MLAVIRHEIAQQASIFRKSHACIAWLNYVPHWIAEKFTIAWLAMEYIRTTNNSGAMDVSKGLDIAEQGCNCPLRLMEYLGSLAPWLEEK